MGWGFLYGGSGENLEHPSITRPIAIPNLACVVQYFCVVGKINVFCMSCLLIVFVCYLGVAENVLRH